MIQYTITTDAEKMAAIFGMQASSAPAKAAAITQRNGERMLKMIQQLSPVRTGEYRASHQIVLSQTGNVYSAEVYTDLARGRMLEFGGPMPLPGGGTVDRRPQPHYRPAFGLVGDQYYEELSRFVTL